MRFALAPLFALFAGCAHVPLASTTSFEARVRAAVAEVRAAAYPELTGDIDVSADLDDDAVFFQSNFDAAAALAEGRLAFRLQANPRAAAIDDDALRGVIAHELGHSLDYARRAKAGTWLPGALAPLAYPALFPAASTWERATDLIAVDRGYGGDLLRYRVWLFRALDGDAVREKRAVYYAPLELALLVDVKARCPALFASFLAAPPTTPAAIAERCP